MALFGPSIWKAIGVPEGLADQSVFISAYTGADRPVVAETGLSALLARMHHGPPACRGHAPVHHLVGDRLVTEQRVHRVVDRGVGPRRVVREGAVEAGLLCRGGPAVGGRRA